MTSPTVRPAGSGLRPPADGRRADSARTAARRRCWGSGASARLPPKRKGSSTSPGSSSEKRWLPMHSSSPGVRSAEAPLPRRAISPSGRSTCTEQVPLRFSTDGAPAVRVRAAARVGTQMASVRKVRRSTSPPWTSMGPVVAPSRQSMLSPTARSGRGTSQERPSRPTVQVSPSGSGVVRRGAVRQPR